MVESTVTYESFTLAREYPHSPEKVFRNFSDPARKRKWFAEGEGSILQSFEMDVRVGGKETGVFLMNHGCTIAHRSFVTCSFNLGSRRH